MSKRALEIFDALLEDGGLKGLDAYCRFALFILCKRENERDRRCFPSYNALARDVGCSLSSVRRAIKNLVKAGLIRYVPGRKFETQGRGTKSNSYVLFPNVEEVCDVDGKCTIEELDSVRDRVGVVSLKCVVEFARSIAAKHGIETAEAEKLAKEWYYLNCCEWLTDCGKITKDNWRGLLIGWMKSEHEKRAAEKFFT